MTRSWAGVVSDRGFGMGELENSAACAAGSAMLEQLEMNLDEELLNADTPANTGLGFGGRLGKRCLSELGAPRTLCMTRCQTYISVQYSSRLRVSLLPKFQLPQFQTCKFGIKT